MESSGPVGSPPAPGGPARPSASGPKGQPVAVPNSLKMSFVLVPPGAFEMAPRYHVTITKPYRLGATEVTRKQFAAFVKATGHVTLAEGGALIKAFAPDPKAPAGTWREPGHPVGDDMPVTWVSAADAEAMADYLTRTEGVTYRLPTEAEWRWACRAGAATRYPFGDTASELPHYATYKANTPGFPAYAGGRRPNAWGLYDMLGNVREWVADGMGPFPEGAAPDPLVIPRPNGYRVQCGGSFAGDPVYAGRPPGWGHMTCDCDTRLGAYWFVAAKDAGFRLCRDP